MTPSELLARAVSLVQGIHSWQLCACYFLTLVLPAYTRLLAAGGVRGTVGGAFAPLPPPGAPAGAAVLRWRFELLLMLLVCATYIWCSIVLVVLRPSNAALASGTLLLTMLWVSGTAGGGACGRRGVTPRSADAGYPRRVVVRQAPGACCGGAGVTGPAAPARGVDRLAACAARADVPPPRVRRALPRGGGLGGGGGGRGPGGAWRAATRGATRTG